MLSQVLGHHWSHSPLLLFLESRVDNSDCLLEGDASLMARQLILLRWRDPTPPTRAQWLTEVMSCLKLEKIRYSLQHSSEKFQEVWGPFFRHVSDLSTI